MQALLLDMAITAPLWLPVWPNYSRFETAKLYLLQVLVSIFTLPTEQSHTRYVLPHSLSLIC